MDEVADLAPLHDPPALEAVRLVRRACPEVPVVACFDTAFFGGLPAAAATYAVPWTWTERWGLRRFGFHGLSRAYASRRAAVILDRPAAELRLVIYHFAAGASLAAIAGEEPVDTTGWDSHRWTGWSWRPAPAPSIPGSSSGCSSMEGCRWTRDRLRGDERAALALSVYLHRLRGGIASMAASLGGLDALVFTRGVGRTGPHQGRCLCRPRVPRAGPRRGAQSGRPRR